MCRTVGGAGRNAVFLVHGHDHAFRDEVDEHLRSLGVEPVVLSKVGGASQSLFQKFPETLAREAAFAVVLVSADDVGRVRVVNLRLAKGVATRH